MTEEKSSNPTADANEGIRKEFFANFLKAAGASPVEMNQTDSSDDASSSSSHPSPPPESPTPSQTHSPPRTSSTPDQPPSLQADSPTELEAAAIDGGTPEAEGTSSGNIPQSPSPVEEVFRPGIGYQAVPVDPEMERKSNNVFIHLNCADTVVFNVPPPGQTIRELVFIPIT
ncbi:hypothetical protein CAEBREN_15561 [Caenorhabditis brenneri]|uniref:Uncharacterized protein n=1 Tax=Caenorhabditis brenneri TaxID=135651 RepID=G0MHJ9_CAEBE|nr:hypothetical protein CAEBREN_15561 [Caenorhabditis brenneri]